MRKSDKKLDNQLRLGLTEVCEIALKDIEGFVWLTHLVNYTNFPSSLRIVCVFDTNENRDAYLRNFQHGPIESLIQSELASIGIKVKKIADVVRFDSEENCDNEHNGNWAKRLAN